MASTYNANPPNYADPSAADDISSLVNTALAVQEGLFNAREGLQRIKTDRVNELLPRLIDTEEKYIKLLNESRKSATQLYNAIQSFTEVAIPISQDLKNTVEERVAIVQDFANKIALSAHQDLQPYDEQVNALKENLSQLLVELTTTEAALKEESRLGKNVQIPSRNGAKDKSLLPTVPFKNTTSVVDEAVLRDVSDLVNLFSGLVGKLGHFGSVWGKLVADSAELSGYLSLGVVDQDVIGNRVRAEMGVYEKIKQALDDYCLRTK